jgi:hypothetical protein
MLFSVSMPASRARGSAVTSFCLNCSYKLPVHRVHLGVGRGASPLRRRLLHLAAKTAAVRPSAHGGNAVNPEAAQPTANPANYSRDLRAIWQDMENLRLAKFNLECAGSFYLVWTRGDGRERKLGSGSILPKSRLRRLWSNRSTPYAQGEQEYVALGPRRRVIRYRYTERHIEKIEQLARRRRRRRNGMADGHSLSQLLRSIGALIERRNETLLGIAWQETSVSVVFADQSGRRGIDIFRPDELYDFWVKMYLQRNRGALLNQPS